MQLESVCWPNRGTINYYRTEGRSYEIQINVHSIDVKDNKRMVGYGGEKGVFVPIKLQKSCRAFLKGKLGIGGDYVVLFHGQKLKRSKTGKTSRLKARDTPRRSAYY
jgi:hypothetical protein